MPDQTPRRGGRWADHRSVINGVLWRTRTSSPWRDLPSDYEHGKTVYNRHRRWSAEGPGPRSSMSRAVVVIRTPKLASRCSGRWGSNDKESSANTDREALGRSRGGLTTTVHFAADQRCRPISRVITPGQRHDSVAFEPVMAGIRIRRRGLGRPRTRPERQTRVHLRRNRRRRLDQDLAPRPRPMIQRTRPNPRPKTGSCR
ncbi:MAG: transposase [Pseudonocardiaceae bacterium]